MPFPPPKADSPSYVRAVFLAVCMASLCACAGREALREGESAVAVWDIEDHSPLPSGMQGMGGIMASEIVRCLQEKGIQVVERERLVRVLEELRLGSSAVADEEEMLRIGRMVGAREMVFGSYMVVGSTMRVDLRRVDVETGKVVKTAKETAAAFSYPEWIGATRRAAQSLY